MSTSLKLIIPLTLYPITLSMLSKEAGFVEAFTNDINKPWLEDRIFLMYEFDMSTKEKAIRFEKMRSMGLKPYKYKIKNQWYHIYAIPYVNKGAIASKIWEFMRIYEPDDLYKIVTFWKNTDKELTKLLFTSTLNHIRFEKSNVPEEDEPTEETEGLTIEKPEEL